MSEKHINRVEKMDTIENIERYSEFFGNVANVNKTVIIESMYMWYKWFHCFRKTE